MMSTLARLLMVNLATLGLLLSTANAERLIVTIAPSKISISSNYEGGHIVVFGAIADAKELSRSYDAVIMITGPREDLIVRRKERILGIWVNRNSSTFIGVPSYLAVSANRPFDTIASPEILRYHHIGLENSIFLDQSVDQNDPFQTNLIDARIQTGLFVTQPRGVSFVGRTVFRADIPLPKRAPIGTYKVDTQIFANGRPITEDSSTLQVEKIGLPQFVVASSINHSLIYGLATMGMALLTGWIASIAFRRS
jgi:uncharacterized protein (TIGR02186 family)